jgi:hypothetical protein
MSDAIKESPDLPKGTTLEEVWALFKETDRRIQETDRILKERSAETDRRMQETDRMLKERSAETDRRIQETDRILKERSAETDRMLKEMSAETDRRIQETNRQLGKLGNRLGEIVEHLMSPKLHEKFASLNLRFERFSRNHEITGENGKFLAEIDVLLENGEYAMAVEVKTRLSAEDVQDHIRRMEILRGVADKHGDRRKYLGAVAGAMVEKDVVEYANRNGLYVIIPSGDTVTIEIPDDFRPREW